MLKQHKTARRNNGMSTEGNARTTKESARTTEENAWRTEENARTTEENARTTEENARTTEDNARRIHSNFGAMVVPDMDIFCAMDFAARFSGNSRRTTRYYVSAFLLFNYLGLGLAARGANFTWWGSHLVGGTSRARGDFYQNRHYRAAAALAEALGGGPV